MTGDKQKEISSLSPVAILFLPDVLAAQFIKQFFELAGFTVGLGFNADQNTAAPQPGVLNFVAVFGNAGPDKLTD